MKKIFKYAMLFATACVISMSFTACGDDDDKEKDTPVTPTPTPDPTEDAAAAKKAALTAVNVQFVNQTAIATYKGLADACETLQEQVESLDSQSGLEKVCDQWKVARQYWEWSEAFLFGAASGYGIDPHIDTWPFDVTVFNTFASKFDVSDEDDVAIIEENVRKTENFTGFHALEYVIFRDGAPRQFTDLTDFDKVFIELVAADLYLSACRLEAAWAGIDNVKKSRQELLEEEELEPEDNFGDELANAGNSGSRWSSATLGSIQIIEGCQDIIGEVADSKIGAAYTGSDVNYIESPHAYNSIQDFYDNIMSCKHALYGGLTQNGTSPATGSLMAYAEANHATEAAAAKAALENALSKIEAMKKPFVLNYTDASAGVAIDALHELDEALDDLKSAIED